MRAPTRSVDSSSISTTSANLPRPQGLRGIRDEIAADASARVIRGGSQGKPRCRAERDTDGTAEETNETAERRSAQRRLRQRVFSIGHGSPTIVVFGDHSRDVHPDAAVVLQLAEGTESVVRFEFVVEHCHEHPIHRIAPL
jgi:hypothetical protein